MAHVLPSFPPLHQHSSQTVSRSEAQALLETYITASTASAHLHPDALLTPTGVAFSAASGPQGGVVLAGMRRVARGLAGENMAVAPEELLALEALTGGGERKHRGGAGLEGIGKSRDRALLGPDGTPRRGVLKKGVVGEEGEGAAGEGAEAGDEDEGVMDAEEYARTRDAMEDEVGDMAGVSVVEQGADAPPELMTDEAPRTGEKRKLTDKEKADRKAEKAKRTKAAKVEKAKIRSGQV